MHEKHEMDPQAKSMNLSLSGCLLGPGLGPGPGPGLGPGPGPGPGRGAGPGPGGAGPAGGWVRQVALQLNASV